MARLTYETKYNTIVIEEPSDDLFISEFLDLCRRVAMAAQYDHIVWQNGVLSLAAEYEEEDLHDKDK